MYRNFGKRALDLALALLILPFALPVMGVLAILIRRETPGPALFRQKRPGKNSVIFEYLKLRSMRVEHSYYGKRLTQMERMTRVGGFMRAYGLDRLPQLFNVLRGEMSFIGPRPLLEQYIDLYTPRQLRRHEVRPGMTGWTRVEAGPDTTWEERFEMDVYYVENLSFALDRQIAKKALRGLFRRRRVDVEALLHSSEPFPVKTGQEAAQEAVAQDTAAQQEAAAKETAGREAAEG